MPFTRSDVEFRSGGLRCASWLYFPDADGPLPLVVMGHGFSGTREMRLDAPWSVHCPTQPLPRSTATRPGVRLAARGTRPRKSAATNRPSRAGAVLASRLGRT
jgi:fermentation-respiration switch protein FrsA (DUF1100 family)